MNETPEETGSRVRPAPPPLMKDIDGGSALPNSGAKNQKQSMRWWMWISIAVATALAVGVGIWLAARG